MSGATGTRGGNWVVSATPAVAGFATLCAATALSSVIDGGLWLVHLAVAIAVVAGVGVLLRSLRLPSLLVVAGQLLALLCLLVTVFTRTGVLVVFPGPQSLSDLGTVLSDAITEVQTGVPPVPSSAAMSCLVMVAIGVVSVLVDALAVGAGAPAASGLVLLCVFAVPASLADAMLPVWTFVCGAGAFALLLAVDGQHKHSAWRGRLGGGGGGSGSAATGVAALAVVVALLAGMSLTLVGTVGRLPGTGDDVGGGSGGLGIDPMTELRGMLNQGASREMFKVRGLGQSAYLRAMTLRDFVPDKGWQLGGNLPEGDPANAALAPQPGDDGAGEVKEVRIEPVTWVDNWLPVYGRPRRLSDVDENWRYDPGRGMVYSVRARKADEYKLETVLTEPSADVLRKASGALDIDPAYLQAPGVRPEVRELAQQITRDQTNTFDKARALWAYFTDGTHGFKYTTQTKNDTNVDALSDFLFNGKTGFCEQYASAMAIMARAVGLPARVALGFTAGYPTEDALSITTQDAHAWVEVYFPGYGWMTFDPTPLTDGRSVTPSYINGLSPDGDEPDDASGVTSAPTTTTEVGTSTTAVDTANGQNQADANRDEQAVPLWHKIALIAGFALALLLALLAWTRIGPARVRPIATGGALASGAVGVVLAVGLVSWWVAALPALALVAAVPAVIRTWRRRSRLAVVASLGPDAANAAWQELLAESVDRGTRVPDTETVRVAARRLVRAHNLDDRGRDGLRAVVGAVERSWYSTTTTADPSLPTAVDEVRQSLNRNAPLALKAKIMPRSVLHPTTPADETADSVGV
ncbi:DUF3488 and transglutaminase-like domain-containing protein [Actinosynnema sp. NPDC020468]|uniref:transglutaminase TgpA family protein n=1 Tax=Actinosynnema sp. NPDC020468 TaxID=3154488 RepID=UPI0033DB0DBC